MSFDTWQKILEGADISKVVFVGLGNKYRQDDSAGLVLLSLLKETDYFKKANFINSGTNPENYLEQILMYGPELVVFIDAARFGGFPGEVKFIEQDQLNSVSISTHAFSIKMIEEYLAASLKMKFLYIGIQPLSTDFGEEMSKEVSEGIKNFVDEYSSH